MSEDDQFTNLMRERIRDDYRKHFTEALAKREADKLVYRNKSSGPYSIGNVCWLLSAMGLFYITDVVNVMRYDPAVKRLWLNVGLALCAMNITIALFLILWLTCIKKVSPDDWESTHPSAIPLATAAIVAGGICLNVALWPVWSFLTPLILFVLFMGVVVTIAMIPGEMPFSKKKVK